MKSFYFLSFAALLTLCACQAQDGQSIDSCYYCESSKHQGCVDPFDKTLGSKMRCTEFNNGQAQRSAGLPQQPSVERFPRLFEKKSRNAEKPEYRCIKTQVVQLSTQTPEIVRMCTPVYPTVKSGCDYLKEFLDDDYSMRTCDECKTGNDCNAGVALKFSMLTLVSVLLLIAM